MCGRRTPEPKSATPAAKIRLGRAQQGCLRELGVDRQLPDDQDRTNPISPYTKGSLMNRRQDLPGARVPRRLDGSSRASWLVCAVIDQAAPAVVVLSCLAISRQIWSS